MISVVAHFRWINRRVVSDSVLFLAPPATLVHLHEQLNTKVQNG